MKRHPILLAGLMASACQHYAPLPLPASASLPATVEALPTSFAGAMSVDDVLRLALAQNPTLVAARAKTGVAQAQLLQSGILPNPSLSGAFLPLISGVGVVPAWSAGLSQDIKSLVTYRAKRRSARDTLGQVSADLLWQEWQVAGQARQLAIDLIGARRQLPVAGAAYAVLRERSRAVDTALAQQDTTLIIAAPTRAAMQTARTNLQAVEQRELQLHHQLSALLGLQPDAPLVLVDTIDLPPFNPQAIRQSLQTLPDRRPDLLALRLGYAAQDETFRQAILAQFPDLVLGGSG